jgi:hypothetical protein
MPVKLKVKRQSHRGIREGWLKPWDESPAFAVNPRGLLTHRVKHVETILHDGKTSHHYAIYWCHNGCHVEVGFESNVLTDNPPKDRLLCHFCENNAQANKQLNADKLAKRHIHRGVLKAQRVCCPNR